MHLRNHIIIYLAAPIYGEGASSAVEGALLSHNIQAPCHQFTENKHKFTHAPLLFRRKRWGMEESQFLTV